MRIIILAEFHLFPSDNRTLASEEGTSVMKHSQKKLHQSQTGAAAATAAARNLSRWRLVAELKNKHLGGDGGVSAG